MLHVLDPAPQAPLVEAHRDASPDPHVVRARQHLAGGQNGDRVAPGQTGERAQVVEPRGQRFRGAPAAGGLAADRALEPAAELARSEERRVGKECRL